MLTKEQAKEIRQRNTQYEAWIDSIRGKNGWASYKTEDKPADIPDVSNEERSALECYDFVQNPPCKYFLYIDEKQRKATTWVGDSLGSVYLGSEYRDNFGGKRQSVTVHAINGMKYHGTYFKSAGNYARVKLAKGAK